MAETRYWRCKTCGAVYYNDPKTAPADWAWGCGKCFNPMEPVVVLPVAEHAALVALRDAVESDAVVRDTIATVWKRTAKGAVSSDGVLLTYRAALLAVLWAGGKP